MKQLFVIAITTLGFLIFNLQAAGGISLKINSAEVKLSPTETSFLLHGINFDIDPLDIMIGGNVIPLSSCTISTTTIECSLTGTPVVEGSTYTVSISAGNAPAKNEEIDVFIPVGTTLAQCNSGDFVECYSGEPATKGVGVCQSGFRTCSVYGTWSNVCEGETIPQTEICNDSLDNDCDTFVDCADSDCLENLACIDPCDPNPCGINTLCTNSGGEAVCQCVAGYYDLNESLADGCECFSTGVEICDGVDNDCDGDIDEDCVSGATLVINEIDYNQEGLDNMEFIEIFNPTEIAVDLFGINVVFVNGADLSVYESIDLSSHGTLYSSGYLVIGAPGLPVAAGALKIDFPLTENNIQNGPDGVKLIGSEGVIDSLAYGGDVLGCTEGDFLVEADIGLGSLGRVNGFDSDNNDTDFQLYPSPTPGGPNSL